MNKRTLALTLAALALPLTACDPDDAGDVVDEAQDAVEDAADEAGDAIDDAADKVDDAVDDAKN